MSSIRAGLTAIDRLLGEWTVSGEMDLGDGQTLRPTGRASFERLGPFVIARSTMQPPEFPDTILVIEPEGDDGAAETHYFDERGVQRRYLTSVTADRLTIMLDDQAWRESPGYRQRYVGEIAADASRITGAWQRGLDESGDVWEVDFTLDYERTR
jgi:hypothetical protein